MASGCPQPAVVTRYSTLYAGSVTHRVALVLWLGVTGCSGAHAQRDANPIDALVAWTEALEAGHPHEAWALLAPAAREGLDEREFVALFTERRGGLLERARQLLSWARTHPAAEWSEVSVGSDRLRLVRTRDGWRIVGPTGTGGAASGSERPPGVQ
jgi:hypothetical protein